MYNFVYFFTYEAAARMPPYRICAVLFLRDFGLLSYIKVARVAKKFRITFWLYATFQPAYKATYYVFLVKFHQFSGRFAPFPVSVQDYFQ
jgi:hypothetical protein